MKAIALVLALFVGQYGPTGIRSEVKTELLTRAAPTASTEGVELKGATSLRVTVCALSPDTLSGTGSLAVWYYSPSGWARNRGADVALGAAGKCETWKEVAVPVGVGRFLAAPSGVGVSGATTSVSVRYELSSR